MMVKIDLQLVLLVLVIGYLVRYTITLIYTKGFKSGSQYMEMKDTKQLMSVAEYLKKTLPEPEARGIELLLSALIGGTTAVPGVAKTEDSSNKVCTGFKH